MERKGKEILKMIYKTTASFFQFIMALGGIIGYLDKAKRKMLMNYSYYFGIAFQVRDDLIDVIGNPIDIGKRLGNDIREKN